MTSHEKLVARYEKAEKQLIDTIAHKAARGNVTAYHQSLLRQIRAVLKRLRRDTPPLVHNVVTDGYRLGLSQSKADNSTVFSILDERQVALLEMNMRAELLKGVNLVGRHMEDALRAAALEANAQKITTGQTVRDMQKKLTAALTGAKDDALVYFEGGKIGVRYRNGRVVQLSKYTAMVARTTTAEAATRADLQRGEEWGFDLCICNAHNPTCEVCAMYAGRTYATTREAASGKYYGLRFPYLYDTALNRGYQVIHPNCKHNFTAISAGAYTQAELAEMSHRSMQPFEDTRSVAERRAYAKKQEYNRKLRSDEAQYNRVRAILPDGAPKNFGAFRNMKRANSERYQDLMKDYRHVLNSIANPEDDGIMETRGDTIKKPIEFGHPIDVIAGARDLSARQQGILNKLPEYGSQAIVNKRDVSMLDLAAMSAQTGDEFAMFTLKGTRLIVRGSSAAIPLSEAELEVLSAEGYRWSGHTHPGHTEADLIASDGDKRALGLFNQNNSAIYNATGRHRLIREEEP